MKNLHVLEALNSSRGRRLLRLCIAAICLVMVTWLAFNTSFESHRLLHNGADLTARSLTKQLAKNAALPLSRNDNPRLSALANHLAGDDFVLQVSIYDFQGRFVVGNDGNTAPTQYQQLPQTLPGLSKTKSIISEPVYTPTGQPLGFVNMVYLTEAAMSQSHAHFHELGRVVLLMLIITMVFTWQIGRGLKGWEVKRKIRKKVKTLGSPNRH
ncbi:AhpA/YtjB family protein [Pseudoalteromonas sp. PS5]|uniref:AhpA/YtjB family protein n=1 Tax=Pseudoalteromonas sp. PS5 TaxID=1437473 RepID=UPI000FFF3C8B|nr:AhpA/YtjB family protein [Pseudoalteromonas sp. PS5]RXF03174.1 smp protein [Pseudoalteromonas sp. PS5]